LVTELQKSLEVALNFKMILEYLWLKSEEGTDTSDDNHN